MSYQSQCIQMVVISVLAHDEEPAKLVACYFDRILLPDTDLLESKLRLALASTSSSERV